MAKGVAIRFIGRLASEGTSIVYNLASGNTVGLAIDACQQTIALVSSMVSYSEEVNRTGEIQKQIGYKKEAIDIGIDEMKSNCDERLLILKEKLHNKYLNEKLELNNKLEFYKREISVVALKVGNNHEEEMKLRRMTQKLCGQLNSILNDIEKNILLIQDLEKDKTKLFVLQEDFRAVQQQVIKILNR